MLPKIENRSYSYQGDNVCTVSATLNIYHTGTLALVASTGLSATYNISQLDFIAEITRQLNEQVVAYMTKLATLDALRQQLFPDHQDNFIKLALHHQWPHSHEQ